MGCVYISDFLRLNYKTMDNRAYIKIQFELYDNIAEFIENYELGKKAKKDAATPKSKGIEKFLDSETE